MATYPYTMHIQLRVSIKINKPKYIKILLSVNFFRFTLSSNLVWSWYNNNVKPQRIAGHENETSKKKISRVHYTKLLLLLYIVKRGGNKVNNGSWHVKKSRIITSKCHCVKNMQMRALARQSDWVTRRGNA